MNIESLLDLACAIVANMIKGKTEGEIRKTFNFTVSIYTCSPALKDLKLAAKSFTASTNSSAREVLQSRFESNANESWAQSTCLSLFHARTQTQTQTHIHFILQDDITPEEEEKLCRENPWAFE